MKDFGNRVVDSFFSSTLHRLLSRAKSKITASGQARIKASSRPTGREFVLCRGIAEERLQKGVIEEGLQRGRGHIEGVIGEGLQRGRGGGGEGKGRRKCRGRGRRFVQTLRKNKGYLLQAGGAAGKIEPSGPCFL